MAPEGRRGGERKYSQSTSFSDRRIDYIKLRANGVEASKNFLNQKQPRIAAATAR
jgi:hypothetical protein